MSKYVPPHQRVAEALAQGKDPQAPSSSQGPLGGPTDDNKSRVNAWSQMCAAVRSAASRSGVIPQRNTALRVVIIDSLVIMKILKHWRDFHPLPVNGQLLGSETLDKLEVTNCFPLPQKKEVLAALQQEKAGGDIEERVDEEFDRYQDRMAELMHDVNVDCFTVGWYQTMNSSELKTKEVIESLVAYQELVDKAVMLCFDPIKHEAGKRAFKAYRAHPDFVAKFHKYEADVAQYNKLQPKDILVEVPIAIHNAFLTEACLLEWEASEGGAFSSGCWGSLDISKELAAERAMMSISGCLDTLIEEQDKVQKFQRDSLKQQQQQKQQQERRRLENEQRRLRGEPLLPPEVEDPNLRKIEPPSQINTLLLTSQAIEQTSAVSTACAENISKLFLVNWGSQSGKVEEA